MTTWSASFFEILCCAVLCYAICLVSVNELVYMIEKQMNSTIQDSESSRIYSNSFAILDSCLSVEKAPAQGAINVVVVSLKSASVYVIPPSVIEGVPSGAEQRTRTGHNAFRSFPIAGNGWSRNCLYVTAGAAEFLHIATTSETKCSLHKD